MYLVTGGCPHLGERTTPGRFPRAWWRTPPDDTTLAAREVGLLEVEVLRVSLAFPLQEVDHLISGRSVES